MNKRFVVEDDDPHSFVVFDIQHGHRYRFHVAELGRRRILSPDFQSLTDAPRFLADEAFRFVEAEARNRGLID
jgi:hypothetical protein